MTYRTNQKTYEPAEPIETHSIKEWQRIVNANAHEKGWYDDGPRNFGEVVALMHSELSEALEEYRNKRGPTETYENPDKPGKPEGIPSEFADVVIRVMDTCQELGIDLEAAIARKHAYNKTREYKHGGKRS